MLMFDSINVDAIPADAEMVLVYTDGKYANETAMRARFPNAQIQTISALGQVEAEWIDCEIGCVWPPAAAVGVYKAWGGGKCRGFYSTTATQQALQEELAHQQIGVRSVEWFNADWNDVPHIDAGDTQTQFESLSGYDVTEVPDPPAPPAPVSPAKEVDMFLVVLSDNGTIGNEGSSWIVTPSGLMPAIDTGLAAVFGTAVSVSNGQAALWSAQTPKH